MFTAADPGSARRLRGQQGGRVLFGSGARSCQLQCGPRNIKDQ